MNKTPFLAVLVAISIVTASCHGQLPKLPSVRVRFEIDSKTLERNNSTFSNQKDAIERKLSETTVKKIREKGEFAFLNWMSSADPTETDEIELVARVFDNPNPPATGLGHVQIEYFVAEKDKLIFLNEFMDEETDLERGKKFNDIFVNDLIPYPPETRRTAIQKVVNYHFDDVRFREQFNQHFLGAVRLFGDLKIESQNVLLPIDFEELSGEPLNTIFHLKFSSNFPEDNVTNLGNLDLILQGAKAESVTWFPSGKTWDPGVGSLTQFKVDFETFTFSADVDSAAEELEAIINKAIKIDIFVKRFVPQREAIIPGTTIDG